MTRYEYSDHTTEYFKCIDTPNKGTTFGFTLADGSVHNKYNTIEIGLQASDEPYLIKYKNAIRLQNPIKVTSTNYNTLRARLLFTNAEIKKDLINLGCMPKKSLILNPPPLNKIHCDISNIIGGYVDGDGGFCVVKTKYKSLENHTYLTPQFKVSGTKAMLDWIASYLPVNVHIYPDSKSEIYHLYVTAIEDVIILGDYLYSNDRYIMQRKYDKFNVIKAIYNKEIPRICHTSEIPEALK